MHFRPLTLIVVALAVVPRIAAAQAYHPAWSQMTALAAFEYLVPTGLASDRSGGVYVAGTTTGWFGPPGPYDTLLRRYDSSGNVAWTRFFSSIDYNYTAGVASDAAGNAYVALGTPSSGSVVEKYDRTGNPVARFSISGDPNTSGSIFVDATGNLTITGSTRESFGGTSNGGYDIFAAKYDASGQRLWKRQFGSSGNDNVHQAAIDAQGNIYLAGETDGALTGNSLVGTTDAFASKIDGNGNLLWTRQFGTSGADRAGGIAVDSVGNYYVAGNTFGSFGAPSAGGSDVFLAKFDPEGNMLWDQQFGSDRDDEGHGVLVDDGGRVLVTGFVHSTIDHLETMGFVRGYDTAGILKQSYVIQLPFVDDPAGYFLAPASSDQVYVAGSVIFGPPTTSIFVQKLVVPEPSAVLPIAGLILGSVVWRPARRYRRHTPSIDAAGRARVAIAPHSGQRSGVARRS